MVVNSVFYAWIQSPYIALDAYLLFHRFRDVFEITPSIASIIFLSLGRPLYYAIEMDYDKDDH